MKDERARDEKRPIEGAAIMHSPQGWQRIAWLGPGFVGMVSAIGSGELLFTPRVGALYGYSLLWALIVLARTGYESQQYDGAVDPKPDNLWDPVPGDYGAHGSFDDQARQNSWHLWLTKHRDRLVLAGAAATCAALAAWRAAKETRGHGRTP
jgi:hypothetical protein